jgi:histidinol phosphatase-like PHP family hydrolase
MNGQWLLSDFHIHTQFSDGSLGVKEVVNHGNNSFGAISITDHILDQQAFEFCLQNEQDPKVISKTDFNDYLHTLWGEARRAWEAFGMLLIPGVETTNNTKGYHILAIDI